MVEKYLLRYSRKWYEQYLNQINFVSSKQNLTTIISINKIFFYHYAILFYYAGPKYSQMVITAGSNYSLV